VLREVTTLILASEGGISYTEAMSWTARKRYAVLIALLEGKGYKYMGGGQFIEPEWMRRKD
jgi:hypothetical protein